MLTASNAQDGYKLLQKHADEIGLLLTDQRMPGEKGVWLLERARQLRPHILRILVTAYTDMDAAIAAVNSGAIYKYVTKPWDPAQLELDPPARPGILHGAGRARPVAPEKMSVLRNMMMADRIVSLGLLAAGLSHHIRNSMVAVKTFLDLAPEEAGRGDAAAKNSLRDPDFWNDYHQNVQGADRKNQRPAQATCWTASETSPATPFADEVSPAPDRGRGAGPAPGRSSPPAGLKWKTRFPIRCPPLQVDQPKFDRLFELLLKDELAMLPAGSRIAFAAELRMAARNRKSSCHITDNGPGLPQEALARRVRPVRGARQRAVRIRHQSDGLLFHRPSSRRED